MSLTSQWWRAAGRAPGLAWAQGAWVAAVLVLAGPAWSQPVPAAAAASAPAAARPPLFVLNSLDATISVIDPVTRTELRRLPTGKEPHHLYLSPDEKSLLVANALSDSLTLVDPRTGEVQRTLTGIVDPYQLRFSPDMKWFVTAANRLNHVDIYRVSSGPEGPLALTLVKRVPAARTPSHLNIDSRSTVVYVSLQDSDQLMAIDLQTQTPRWTVPVGKMPADVFLSADDRTLLVGLTGDAFVEAYDVSGPLPRLVTRLRTGEGAHSFRAWGDRRHVLVSNRVANTISRIDVQMLTVVDSYPGPGGPDDMDLSQDRRWIYVASRWARKLSIIDTQSRQVVQQVPVGKSPHGVWLLEHAGRQ